MSYSLVARIIDLFLGIGEVIHDFFMSFFT
jgi:hypothetical protein